MYTLKLLLMFKMQSEVHMLFKKNINYKFQKFMKKTSNHCLAEAFAEKCVSLGFVEMHSFLAWKLNMLFFIFFLVKTE